VRAQMWFGGKTPYPGGGFIADVKPEHRLPATNPTFRGNLLVTEGRHSSTAILSQSDGMLLQELPFSIELKKFVVEHYSTGMPKLFASDIVIHDLATGAAKAARVEVNHPVRHRGVEIYQSSFDDGGSELKLRARPLVPGAEPFDVAGVVGGSTQLTNTGTGEALTLEFTGLRVLNVENFGDNGASASGADVRKVDLRESIESRLGAGNKTVAKRELRNVGPSVSYKLRDAAGQAREFNNFMLPVDTGDGQAVFLLGVRETQADPMRYLRVPVDAEGRMDGFVRLRLALADPALREKAVRRYAAAAVDAKRPELAEQLAQSAARALALFAGDTLGDGTMEKLAAVNGRPLAGLPAISEFMEANVPEGERERAAEVLMRIMNGALFELAQITREQAGLAPLEPGEKTQAFMTQAVLSLSDSQAYPAPMVFELTDFKQIQASVFEVARAPGKNVVYLGCALLIIGIFAMLYVRDRRLWVWLAPGSGGAQATMALSANRKTLDTDREFAQLRTQLLGLNEGYFARRNWLDWLFAALVLAGGLFALQRYGAHMDVYEKGILLGSIPGAIWLGWFWRPLRLLMLAVAGCSLLAIGLYQNNGAGDLARAETVFGLKYFLSSQSAILWMSMLFFMSTAFYWIGMFSRGQGPAMMRIGSRIAW